MIPRATACTVPFDVKAAQFLKGKMVESVIAPDFTPEALEELKKKKNIMLLKLDVAGIGSPDTPVVRQVLGGMLMQDPDKDMWEKWEVVTKADFPENIKELAKFSMIACAAIIRSNGSRCSPGNPPARIACELRMATSRKPSISRRSCHAAMIRPAPGSFPSRCLVDISHAEPELT